MRAASEHTWLALLKRVCVVPIIDPSSRMAATTPPVAALFKAAGQEKLIATGRVPTVTVVERPATSA
jgi:hypothetical protein